MKNIYINCPFLENYIDAYIINQSLRWKSGKNNTIKYNVE